MRTKIRIAAITAVSGLLAYFNGCGAPFESISDQSGFRKNLIGERICENPKAELPAHAVSAVTPLEYINIAEDLSDANGAKNMYDLVSTWAPVARTFHFDRNSVLLVDELFAKDRWSAANLLANLVTEGLQCPGRNIEFLAQNCISEALKKLGPRAYRRALTSEETTQLLNLFMTTYQSSSDINGLDAFTEGSRAAFLALFASPQFHLKFELPPANNFSGIVPLTSEQLATRLAFYLTGSIPDETTWQKGVAGDLASAQALEEEAERLLALPKNARRLALQMGGQWLTYDTKLQSDQEIEGTDLVEADLAFESFFVFEELLTNEYKISALLKPGFTIVNKALADHYGISGSFSANGFSKVNVSDRGGFLHQATLMHASSDGHETKPVGRGIWVLDRLLCEYVPIINAATQEQIQQSLINLAHLPVHERLAIHREDRSCASCHNMMDPIGLGLENYDAFGHWRTDYEDGRPVVSNGHLYSQEFSDTKGLIDVISESRIFSDCVKKKVLSYASGQDPYRTNSCSLNELDELYQDVNEENTEVSTPKAVTFKSLFSKAVLSSAFLRVKHEP